MGKLEEEFMAEYMQNGEDVIAAATKIFAKSKKHRNALAYARTVLKNSDYVRAKMEYFFNIFECTDQALIRHMQEGLMLLDWRDAKQAQTKLNLIKEIFKLKGRYPESSRPIMISQEINHTNNIQLNVLKQAQDELPDEELKELIIHGIESVSSAPTTIDRNKLFDVDKVTGGKDAEV